jgi:hypothetical protein
VKVRDKMDNYNQALKEVYSQVAPEVNDLYEYYRAKNNLEEERDTERQLEILTQKKYISNTYIANLSLITDYYVREMTSAYLSSLEDYKNRIKFFLEM